MAEQIDPNQGPKKKPGPKPRSATSASWKPTAGKPTNNSWGGMRSAQQVQQWLIDNPDFDDMPATMEEFLGPAYLNIDPTQNPNLRKGIGVRPGVKQALLDIFGDAIDPKSISIIRRGMFTGGIGVGKSTLAAIAMAYCVHWVSCLHNPQEYFGLLPGSRIAFMLMSTKESQALEVLFGDVKARIDSCQWFINNCMYDKSMRKQLRFPKSIWIIPGNSAETTFEGYNILMGIIDEGDSHKMTEEKDYAMEGWNTIEGRISSRYTDPETEDHRGLLLAIGQMKKSNGFMAKKKKQLLNDGKANQLVVQMTIWDSLGWDKFLKPNGERNSFWFDVKRKREASKAQIVANSPEILEIPMAYWKDFDNDPVRALKDHAGIPPKVSDPFITMTDRIDEAQDKWHERYKSLWPYAVNSNAATPQFHPDFKCTNILKRAAHVDIAYAPGGDAMGMAMGHIPELVEIDGELKPIIVFDFLLRIKPGSGTALELADFRRILINLRDEMGFKISVVTFDGFQSMDSIQILRKRRFNVGECSVDKNKAPYEELREALYERRIEFPHYMTYLNRGDTEKVDIANLELSELQDTGKKIDHPEKGSKDIADAMAGVVYDLMGNITFRRGSSRPTKETGEDREAQDAEDYNRLVIGEKISVEDERIREDIAEPIATGPRYPQVDRPGYGLPAIERDPFGLSGASKP